MKRINKFLNFSAVTLAVSALLSSCAMDAPFGEGGEGTLTLTTDIRGDVSKTTRALGESELQQLREKCIVYIENNLGVIRKYKGVDNIPSQIKLGVGSYVAEAWSGDSVSASFDKKWYRGYQKFDIVEGSNALTLRCNIANVIVSVDPASLDIHLSDLKVTFSHTRGELVFTDQNIADAKGYFMMPDGDFTVNYKVEGTKSDGSPYSREGKIENVERAHEYCMLLTEEERPVTEGGALINLTIADIPVIDDEVEIFPAPALTGRDFNVEDQVIGTPGSFSDRTVIVRGYFGLASVTLGYSDNFSGLPAGLNLMTSAAQTELAEKGIRVELATSHDAAPSVEGGEVKVDDLYITFSKAFLDALPESDKEYTFYFDCVDVRHNESIGVLRIANTTEAIESLPPVSTPEITDFTAVTTNSARLVCSVNTEDAIGMGVKYRASGQSEWTFVPADGSNSVRTRATRGAVSTYTVTLKNLTPGTTYQYKAAADDYEAAEVMNFTTESPFAIVNASFEDWSTYSASTLLGTKTVILPGSTGNKSTSFWGSGNEGAATANKTLTNKSTDMVHSGSYSARLGSDAAMGIIAAGNIFVGEYVETDGTNGVLSLGREYNGSHPTKVRVYANYRPGGSVTVKSGNEGFIEDLVSGGTDQGQIYVALTDEPVEIRTNPSKRKLFSTDDPHVLAYGQVTWKAAFGPDGQLQMVEIPFEYFDRAKTVRPTHLVIVASASKFGDYFCGSKTSVMYLDDFELIYE